MFINYQPKRQNIYVFEHKVQNKKSKMHLIYLRLIKINYIWDQTSSEFGDNLSPTECPTLQLHHKDMLENK